MDKPQYYVSVCPDTGQQFLVEHGKDDNIVELSPEVIDTLKLRVCCQKRGDCPIVGLELVLRSILL